MKVQAATVRTVHHVNISQVNLSPTDMWMYSVACMSGRWLDDVPCSLFMPHCVGRQICHGAITAAHVCTQPAGHPPKLWSSDKLSTGAAAFQVSL